MTVVDGCVVIGRLYSCDGLIKNPLYNPLTSKNLRIFIKHGKFSLHYRLICHKNLSNLCRLRTALSLKIYQ